MSSTEIHVVYCRDEFDAAYEDASRAVMRKDQLNERDRESLWREEGLKNSKLRLPEWDVATLTLHRSTKGTDDITGDVVKKLAKTMVDYKNTLWGLGFSREEAYELARDFQGQAFSGAIALAPVQEDS